MIRYRLAPEAYLLMAAADCGPATLKPAADACIAELLDIPACDISVSRTSRGMPVLDAPARGWFSRAHRPGLTLIAASRTTPIGADLELVDDSVPYYDIAHAFFEPAEAAWLKTVPRLAQPAGFFALWTIKEAVLKATGEGIANGLAHPCVDAEGRTTIASMTTDASVRTSDYTVRLFTRQLGNRAVIAAIATPVCALHRRGGHGDAGSRIARC